MSAKLKKRSWVEFSGEGRSDRSLTIKGKTVLTDDGEHSRLEFHLNNLLALFPDLDEAAVRKVYLQTDKDIDKTLTELEMLQSKQLETGASSTRLPNQPEERPADQGVIEAELRNEMTGLEQSHDRALQRLKSNASNNIDTAIGMLKNCKTNDDARNVLENLLSFTLGWLF